MWYYYTCKYLQSATSFKVPQDVIGSILSYSPYGIFFLSPSSGESNAAVWWGKYEARIRSFICISFMIIIITYLLVYSRTTSSIQVLLRSEQCTLLLFKSIVVVVLISLSFVVGSLLNRNDFSLVNSLAPFETRTSGRESSPDSAGITSINIIT